MMPLPEHVVRGEQDGRAVLLAIGRKMLPDPVGGVGIERSGRLVEQQQFRLVDQCLCQCHAGLLSGRKFSVGAIKEVTEVEVGGKLFDTRGQICDRVEAAEDRQVLPHREPCRHIDIRTFEIHPAKHFSAFIRYRMAQNLDASGTR
jgi:hypothetical protein